MSTVTAELNDLATQAILKPADGGGYHLTVTDGCDVIVVRLGDHGVGQVALALASYKPTEPLPGLLDIDEATSLVRSSRMAQHPKPRRIVCNRQWRIKGGDGITGHADSPHCCYGTKGHDEPCKCVCGCTDDSLVLHPSYGGEQ